MADNATAEQLFFNHWPGCQNCRPRNDIYCDEGRRLWISDKVEYVMSFPSIEVRREKLDEMSRNMPDWIDEIRRRITTEWGKK